VVPDSISHSDLSNNALQGSLPSAVAISSLMGLCGFLYFFEIVSRLTSTAFSALDHNQFVGTIPVELAELNALTYLGLHFNRLSGPELALSNVQSWSVAHCSQSRRSHFVAQQFANAE